MGGLTFAKPGPWGSPLKVPRMPKHIYDQVRVQRHAELAKLFHRVAVPRDAPEKQDFGDIDFLVEGPRTNFSIGERIRQEISAVAYKKEASHHYAVVYPGMTDSYVQVDVEVVSGEEIFEWTNFMKSDSDLHQIIGILHRSLGLVCTDKGLHLRVQEIQTYNDAKSRLFLTRDPDAMMRFYGLDSEKYHEGFATEAELFDWIRGGRFFSYDIFRGRVDKANDPQRVQKRPMYNRFVERLTTAAEEDEEATQGPDAEIKKQWTREEVLRDALKTFHKEDEYTAMMSEHTDYINETAIWKDIRQALPIEGKSIETAMKGLKRWVDVKDGAPYVLSEALADNDPKWVLRVERDEILPWVLQNYEEIKGKEKKRATAAKAKAKG
ncbi:hypothetical protein BDV96DRAFT_585534 [Lophiotrema nucula]|uniref:Uncharacterized protein n=1 Tax=Lophiotrema nucula TaxID=690887 RepID=A0A6A5YSG8_9PLEO|nr:hypothetical protein BDV96DRAFT_585534 [Lophiotrema nucula]